MDEHMKRMLLALIQGLITYEGGSQYYEGTPCIKGGKLDTLIDFIKNTN